MLCLIQSVLPISSHYKVTVNDCGLDSLQPYTDENNFQLHILSEI